MLLGLGLNFVHIDPIKALFWSAVINGVVAVPIMVLMMLMTQNPKVMGEFTLNTRQKLLGWLATAAMLAAGGRPVRHLGEIVMAEDTLEKTALKPDTHLQSLEDGAYHKPGSVDELTKRNIAIVADLETAAKAKRTPTDCVVDAITAFCGTMAFVWVHVVWFSTWAVRQRPAGPLAPAL